MTDFLWPTSVIPARSEVVLRDLSTRFASPFTGTTRTYSRPGGELFGLTLTLPPMKDAQSAALRGLLAKLRGGVNRVWCRDHSYVRRGSFPATEIVANGTFSNGTTGWTANGATLTAADHRLRVLLESTNGTASQNLTTVSGVAYAARVHTLNMSNVALGSGVYIDLGGAQAANYPVPNGFATASVIATGTAGAIVVATNSATSGQFVESDYASLARCALIAGGSQTGATLNVDQLPASTAGLLLEGDQVQIGEELLTVVAPLNSDGSGAGKLFLHRPPRTTPADNAPVIIHEPMGLFMLAEGENGWMNEPGRLLNATVTLIEAPR